MVKIYKTHYKKSKAKSLIFAMTAILEVNEQKTSFMGDLYKFLEKHFSLHPV